jgi:hypothetical protein
MLKLVESRILPPSNNGYVQPERIDVYYDEERNFYVETPVWSKIDIKRGELILEEIIEGAKENNVSTEYYIQEFGVEDN